MEEHKHYDDADIAQIDAHGRAAHQQCLLPQGRENLRLDGRVGRVGVSM